MIVADPTLLVLGALVVLSAQFVGGVVGFAYGLVALPLLLLIGVPLVDVIVVNLVIDLAGRLSIVARRYADVSWGRARLLLLGCVPGVLLGVLTRGRLDTEVIKLSAGVVTLVAVYFIARGGIKREPRKSPPAVVVVAGWLGGFLGVTTSLNGVPPALLLTGDRATARSMVADLAVYFVIGNILTLLILSQSGQAPSSWVWSALVIWVPIGLAGNLLGIALGPRMPYAFFRRLTFTVIVASGVVLSAQAVRAMVG
ncbi:possible sulfate exporter (plasmid) [Rhodococcus jostii RHA1]|uniref:Probable membrane transporter protein n=1 Tax=Rhodococcus jostii (strain RHA1) TaxID=101510 RepID=Q0RXV3_RHOJR|nr:possible sulfate exporter [Rhodococcus jostii RHA1]